MPPKVIFNSKSGRMVSRKGVGAAFPGETEALQGAPGSSWGSHVQ